MKILLSFFLAILVLLTTSCSTQWRVLKINRERKATLLEAGFKALKLNKDQYNHLEKLPDDKITTMKRGGKIYFIYPDLENNQILIGKNRQFMNYNQLITEQLVGPEKANKKLEKAWAQSGVWNNTDGWSNVNLDLDNPFFSED